MQSQSSWQRPNVTSINLIKKEQWWSGFWTVDICSKKKITCVTIESHFQSVQIIWHVGFTFDWLKDHAENMFPVMEYNLPTK